MENIRETRFSRNPVISRVLTECEWVRELNKGVPRIYDEMKGFSLDEPTFIETPYFRLVLLILVDFIWITPVFLPELPNGHPCLDRRDVLIVFLSDLLYAV